MKNKTLLLFSILLSLIGGANGQQVWNMPGELAQDAIVRSVDSHLTLLYREGPAGNNSFLIYDGTTALSVFGLPTGLSIRDMVIHNGMAYFCGVDAGYGAVGYFDVMEAYTLGSTVMNYAQLNPVFGTSAYPMEPLEFTRLDVFDFAGVPIIAAVGNTIIEPIPSYASSTVLSAFHPTGAAFWDCRLLYNKDALIRYSDITCLDDVIAAVGCDNNNTGCYVKMFPRISNFVEIGYALTPGQAWKVDAAPTAGPVLAEEIRGNDFAAAQFSQLKTSTVLHRLSATTGGALSAFSASSITPLSALAYAGNPWQLHDMCFDASAGTIQILERADMPGTATGFAPWKLTFPLTAMYTPINGTLLTSGEEVSMDIDAGTHLPITSGISSNGHLNFYRFVLPTNHGCWSNVSFGVGNTAPTVTPVEMDEQAARFIPTNKTHTLKKEICNIVTECQ